MVIKPKLFPGQLKKPSRPASSLFLPLLFFILTSLVSAAPSLAAETPNLDPARQELLDKHALNVPADIEKSQEQLAAYLVEPAQNDLEKSWAIYRWITANIAYDTDFYFTGRRPNRDAASTFEQKIAVCQGYSDLFTELADYAGLATANIVGYGKGYSYQIGSPLAGNTNHAWSAVKIGERWYLLDSTWGAGYVDENKKFVRRFNAHYFLTPPEEFIYDHFPDDQKWQLLPSPISLEDFAQLPYLRPGFFDLKMKLGDKKQGLIKTDHRLTLVLLTPKEVVLQTRLESGGKKISSRYAFIQKKGDTNQILAIFPQPGDYILKIFAKDKAVKGSFDQVIVYKVVASAGSERATPFPETFQAFQEREVAILTNLENISQKPAEEDFQLSVPGAEAVVVMINGKTHALEKNEFTFTGEMKLLKFMADVPVTIYARYQGSTIYVGLVKFDVP